MHIVIEIPEELYNRFGHEYREENLISKYTNDALLEAFCNGTVLPEGHGKLIDAGEYVDVLNNAQIEGLNTYKGLGRAKELLIETHTIIEADEESEE